MLKFLATILGRTLEKAFFKVISDIICLLIQFWNHHNHGKDLKYWLVFQSKRKFLGSSHCVSAVRSTTSIPEDVGLSPGLAQGVKDAALPWALV